MKILYTPIFEGGPIHDLQVRNKRGLYDALVKHGHQVFEFDYLNNRDGLENRLRELVDGFAPDLLLTQLHGPDVVTPGMMQRLRQQRPDMLVVNWSGDSWRHSLVGEAYLPLVKQFDLQLCAAPDILPEYEMLGFPAAFWQIAYEKPVGELPDMPAYDVVFLGNVISDDRRAMLEMLRSLDDLSVGIYGDWDQADGYNCYDFGAGAALYRQAKVAIADNVYPDQQNYTSNRPIQILMAGGATLLHQHVPRMDTLLGIQADRHYVEWHTLVELEAKIRYWTARYLSGEQQVMVSRGQKYASEHHTYDARVTQLFDELLPMVERVGA